MGDYYVPVTKYVRPNGGRRPSAVDLRGHYLACLAAHDLLCRGYTIAVEELPTGMTAVYVEGFDPRVGEDGDVAVEIIPRATKEALAEAVANAVERAYFVIGGSE